MATTTRNFVTTSKGESDAVIALICPCSSLNCSGGSGDICTAGITVPNGKYNKFDKFGQSHWHCAEFRSCVK